MTDTNTGFKAISKFKPGSSTYECGVCHNIPFAHLNQTFPALHRGILSA